MSNVSAIATSQQRTVTGPIGWAESGLLPDWVIRAGIRRLNRKRLEDISANDIDRLNWNLNYFAEDMARAEIAPVPELANEQHYEVPAAFFDLVLGQHRKYSACLWADKVESLDQAEALALEITCDHAGIEDGQDVLDLGCGWGSLSLWIARKYPGSRVTSVSNSHAQRAHIQQIAREEGLANIQVITCDMNDFDIEREFDRVVSVEMFEHMRNYPALFEKIANWLKPDGLFFMHIFCHRAAAYAFVDNGDDDWMSRHFFSGGIMPAADLPLRFQNDLELRRRWSWNGTHYQKTANAWLKNMDSRKGEILRVLEETYGKSQARTWFQRWRIFFMACAELFGHERGQEWFVSHYRFGRSDAG